MGSVHPPISDSEMEVLKVLWKQGPGTVREIKARLRTRRRRWAYNTVLTLLSRLLEKGYVASHAKGLAHVFRAAITREKLLRRRLTELADGICDGMASPLVHALVQGRRFTAEEIEQFHRLLNEVETKGGEGKPSSGDSTREPS